MCFEAGARILLAVLCISLLLYYCDSSILMLTRPLQLAHILFSLNLNVWNLCHCCFHGDTDQHSSLVSSLTDSFRLERYFCIYYKLDFVSIVLLCICCCLTVIPEEEETFRPPTGPGAPSRYGEEMSSYLTRTEVNVFKMDLVVLVLCDSVNKHTHKHTKLVQKFPDRREQI